MKKEKIMNSDFAENKIQVETHKIYKFNKKTGFKETSVFTGAKSNIPTGWKLI